MRRWKKVLLITGSTILLLTGIAWILAVVYEDQVKSMIITGINEKLKTPVDVKEIDFSFLRKFPYATLEFTDITVQGIGYKELKKPLLTAHKLNLNFSLWDVFSNKVSISKIEISEGSSFIYIMRNGETNYDVWKSSPGNKESSSLDLKEVLMKKLEISYRNDITSDDYSANIKKGKASGSFSAEQFDLNVQSDMLVEHFVSGKVNYLYKKEVSVDLLTHVNTVTKLYQLNKATLSIADLVLQTEGTVQSTDKGNKVSLTINSDNAGLRDILTLIPKEYIKDLDDFRIDGKVNFTATITGVAGKSSTPLIKADFSTSNASVQPDGSDHRLSDISLKGSYVNKKGKNIPVSYLSFENVKAMLDQQPVIGQLLVEDLSDPLISLEAKGNLDLETVSSFYKPDTLSSLSGQLVVNMMFKGRVNNTASYQSSGTVLLKDVSFTLKEKTASFENFNGTFSLDGNSFTISQLNGRASGSDFVLNGHINNLFSFLFKPDQVLMGNAQLSSRNLDLDELLEDKGQSTSRDTAYYLDINKNLNFLLHVNVGVVTFRKFQAWNIKGDIAVHDKVLSTSGLSFKSMDGGWNISGSINASHADSVLMSCNADVNKVDITELFADLGDFGQKLITSKNLKGKLTANIVFAGMWSKTLNCNTDKIAVQSRFTIEQGELIKFEPMMVLSKYLKGADLQDIKFSTLTNSIEIRQRKIYIPAMEIKSSALEMTASGTHSFDNIVDYQMQLLLSQLVGKKVKQQNTEFGTIEDDGLGRTKLFLTMKGPITDAKVRFDSKGVEQKIVQDVRKEKDNLKTILNKEFGWFKKDSVTKQNDPPKKKKAELQIERDDEE